MAQVIIPIPSSEMIIAICTAIATIITAWQELRHRLNNGTHFPKKVQNNGRTRQQSTKQPEQSEQSEQPTESK